MEFDSSPHKIQKSFEREDKNAQEIKNLKKIDIFGTPGNTTKRIIVLPLIQGYCFNKGTGGTFDPSVEFLIGGPATDGGDIILGG